MLTQHSENVWGAERPFAWLGIDVNGRGAVVKLSDGSVWVHSPVKLDPELKAAVDALGTVKYIVTPNFEHNKFAPQVSLLNYCCRLMHGTAYHLIAANYCRLSIEPEAIAYLLRSIPKLHQARHFCTKHKLIHCCNTCLQFVL